jgi:hypothetical protein
MDVPDLVDDLYKEFADGLGGELAEPRLRTRSRWVRPPCSRRQCQASRRSPCATPFWHTCSE